MMVYGPNAAMIDRGPALSLPDFGGASVGGAPSVTDRFSSFVEASLERLNASQVRADEVAQDFLLGADVPVHSVMMELSKADTTLRLATSVIQKAIDAYLDISRMQL